jgi:hypothetical protein
VAVTSKRLGQARLGTSFATLYTAPGNTKAIIRSLHVVNVSTLARSYWLCLVPSGGVANESTALYWEFPIGGRPTILQDDAVHILEAGGTVQAKSDVADALTLTVDGAEET